MIHKPKNKLSMKKGSHCFPQKSCFLKIKHRLAWSSANVKIQLKYKDDNSNEINQEHLC